MIILGIMGTFSPVDILRILHEKRELLKKQQFCKHGLYMYYKGQVSSKHHQQQKLKSSQDSIWTGWLLCVIILMCSSAPSSPVASYLAKVSGVLGRSHCFCESYTLSIIAHTHDPYACKDLRFSNVTQSSIVHELKMILL